MASNGRREDMKVVFIDTQYVQTDPLSFKSVVQNLTGKESSVSWVEESRFSNVKRKREPEISNNGFSQKYYEGNQFKSGGSYNGGSHGACDLKLAKGLSFKDLDRMISEMPPMDEWYQILAQSNLI